MHVPADRSRPPPSPPTRHAALVIFAAIILLVTTSIGTKVYPASVAAKAIHATQDFLFGRARITPRDTTIWVHAVHNHDGSLTCITHWEHPELHEQLSLAGTAPGHTTKRVFVAEDGWGPWFPVQRTIVALSYEFTPLAPQPSSQFYVDLAQSLQQLEEADGHPDWLLRLRDESRRGFGVPRRFVAWPGIVLNLIAIGALVVGIRSGAMCLRLALPHVRSAMHAIVNARADRRRIRGLCPFCAYSMDDHVRGPCPECGKTDDPQPA